MELKVGLHCEECIKKILKAIKKIEGNELNLIHASHKDWRLTHLIRKLLKTLVLVCLADIETYNVDTQLNKVIVTGNVTTEQVIRALQKIGKMASTWSQEEDESTSWMI